MSEIQLCKNPQGQLTGMRSTITKYSTASMAPMSTVALNRIGSVTEANIICSAINLNPVGGEFVSQISFSWDTVQVQHIEVVTSFG